MQLSFYDASVACYQQILDSTANILEKGQQHAEANDMALEEISNYRLQESMLPFSFQIISVWHHSFGAIQGMREGLFMPPPDKPGIDYAGLRGLIDEARDAMAAETEDSMERFQARKCSFDLAATKCLLRPITFWRHSRSRMSIFMPRPPTPSCDN